MSTVEGRLRDLCEAVARAARRDDLLLEITHHEERSCVIQLEHPPGGTHVLLHIMVDGGTLMNEAGETLSLPVDLSDGYHWGDLRDQTADQLAHFIYVWSRGFLFGRNPGHGRGRAL